VVASSTNLARQLRVECVHRTATTIAVRQRCRTQVGVGQPSSAAAPKSASASLHPLPLAHAEVEQPGGFGVDQRPRLQLIEDDDSTLLRRVQNDPVPHGRTESLNSSGRTYSLYFHIAHSWSLTRRTSSVTVADRVPTCGRN
jgi:hypothetical protein